MHGPVGADFRKPSKRLTIRGLKYEKHSSTKYIGAGAPTASTLTRSLSM